RAFQAFSTSVFAKHACFRIKHTTKLDTYVEGMKRGETITIFYNINDLNDITLSGNQFWQAILFGGIGAILMFISIIFIKKRFNKA
ncbi:MAG TPA: hypothetical protein PLG31_12675, partial [Spirochaetota bacterium]|nr:hypothetical protein [Spirochaetota bacterium]